MMKFVLLIFVVVLSCFVQETSSRKLLRRKHELQASVQAADPVFLGVMKTVYVFFFLARTSVRSFTQSFIHRTLIANVVNVGVTYQRKKDLERTLDKMDKIMFEIFEKRTDDW